MIEYVELAAAREATGTRAVVSGIVPSPWSEATKGLFRIAKLPLVAVRSFPGNRELAAWTGVDNVPVVLHGVEPARTSWSAIVGLVARLAPDALVPSDPTARMEVMGAIEMVAGENGLGWNNRLAMVHAGLTTHGARGFSPPVAGYLAKRYGYAADAFDGVRARVASQLGALAVRLAAQRASGHDYFGGARPSALDVYVATFLTPLVPLGERDCPGMSAPFRAAFAAAAEELGPLVDRSLFDLRTRMFERHLAWPIEI